MKTPSLLNIFRVLAILVTIGSAILSLISVLTASQKNDSLLLVSLFVVWVLSPFVGLLATDTLGKGRSDSTHLKLYIFMVFIPLGAILCYSGMIPLPPSKPAFLYLVVPFGSWILMLIGYLLFRKKSKKRRRS